MRTPIIFLTARGGIEDRIEGLEAGADDYLGKPFAFSARGIAFRGRSVAPRRNEVSSGPILDINGDGKSGG